MQTTRVIRSTLRRQDVWGRVLSPAPPIKLPPLPLPLPPTTPVPALITPSIVIQSSGRPVKRFGRIEQDLFDPVESIIIADIWVSQDHLFRRHQIPGMMDSIARGDPLPQIALARCPDGAFQVRDGHHRLLAYWLSGRRTLHSHEYHLSTQSELRRRFGKVAALAGYV